MLSARNSAKELGAIAALEQERLAGADVGQVPLQTARLAGEHQRRIAGQLRLHLCERLRIGIRRHLRCGPGAPARGGPVVAIEVLLLVGVPTP